MSIYKGEFDDYARGIGISFAKIDGDFIALNIDLWKYYIAFQKDYYDK